MKVNHFHGIKLLCCNFIIAATTATTATDSCARCYLPKPTLRRHAVNEFMLKSFTVFPLQFECENWRRVATFLNCSSRFWMSLLPPVRLVFMWFVHQNHYTFEYFMHSNVHHSQFSSLSLPPKDNKTAMTLHELCENSGYIRAADTCPRMCVCVCCVMLPSLKFQHKRTVGTYFSSFGMTPARNHQRRCRHISAARHCKCTLHEGVSFARSLVHDTVPHNISNDENLIEMPVCCSISSPPLISSVNWEIRCTHGMYCSGVTVVT